jgi:hypothetical protein
MAFIEGKCDTQAGNSEARLMSWSSTLKYRDTARDRQTKLVLLE